MADNASSFHLTVAAGRCSGKVGPSLVVVVVTAILAGLGLLALLVIMGRYNETELEIDWHDLITPAGRRAYEDPRARFADQGAAIELTYDRAIEAGAGERVEDAAVLLAGRLHVPRTRCHGA